MLPPKPRPTARARLCGCAPPFLSCRSTQHRGGDDDADSEDHRSSDDGRGHVAVLDDFLVQMPWRAPVEDLVAHDRKEDADGREERHIGDGLAERLRMPS